MNKSNQVSKLEKSSNMCVYVTGQIGGQSLILILHQLAGTFMGQKLHRKLGLIFLYFFIDLLFLFGQK